MKSSTFLFLPYHIFVILFIFEWSVSSPIKHDTFEAFLECIKHSSSISNNTYTQNNVSYSSILNESIQNLRFTSPSTRKPLAVFTPFHEHEIQSVLYCSKEHGLQIRVLSGGHDYEGLSYTSQVPFVIIDMVNLRAVDVDVASRTAWVQSGATSGELYFRIAEKSGTLTFPAAQNVAVGMGGLVSGGGYGMLVRKYGLAGDNVIDARLIDVNGEILDRKSMGEDLFWAIRGGGGGSFGVVLAWKVKLVPVPEKVTVFRIERTSEENATELFHRWQSVAPNVHDDLMMTATMNAASSEGGERTIRVTVSSLFLGGVDRLLAIVQESFPELGLEEQNCTEMSWIESTLYFMGFPTEQPLDVLLNRTSNPPAYFKSKSDYVQVPMPINALDGIQRLLSEKDAEGAVLIFIPYGGKMNEIPDSALPFPHRVGNLYKIMHYISWNEEGEAASSRYITWIRRLYEYVAPYVSKSPRAAYVNYRDLDLGVNNYEGNTSYSNASIWGTKYFKNNFHRLARVKSMVDPTNYFRHEQSIPLLSPW